MEASDASIHPGDYLRIERRYVLDGELTCVTDEGRFQGIERVGSSEHIVLKDTKNKEVRMFPLHAIAEIKLVRAAKKRATATANEATTNAWDPSVG